jgi:hypothetical protein
VSHIAQTIGHITQLFQSSNICRKKNNVKTEI